MSDGIKCRSYVSENGIGEPEQCKQVLNRVSSDLKILFTQKVITGAVTRCISSGEDVASEDLLERSDLHAATNSCFPVVWIFVNIPLEFTEHPQLEALARTFQLKIIDEYDLPK